MRVNKIISAITTGLVGAAVALTQPDVKADDPVIAPKPPSPVISNLKDELNLEGIKKEQDERLQKLLDLPKGKEDEIATVLNDLSQFYLHRFSSLVPYKTKEIRQELLTSAGQKYEKLFLRILELLTNPETQSIGQKNLIALKRVKPWAWSDVISIPELIDIKKHAMKFFKENFQNHPENIQHSIALMGNGLTLLEFTGNQNIDHQVAMQYFSWLEKECHFVANEKNKTKDVEELQEALKGTITEIVNSHYLYFPYKNSNCNDNYPANIQLFSPLVNGYTALVGLDKSNPEVLNEALSFMSSTRNFLINYSARQFPADVKKINDALVPLFDSIVEGINNLPKSQERTDLLIKMFNMLTTYNDTSNELIQSLLVEPLTKHYFSKKENIGNVDEFNLLINGIIVQNTYLQNDRTRFPIYMLLKLVAENKEYFLAGINKSIEHFKAQDTPGKLVHSQDIANYFNFFILLHRLNSETDVGKELREEVRNWVRENIGEPICELFLSKFKDETVTVDFVETRQEHYIHHESWTQLNALLKSMVHEDEYFANKLIDAVKERLTHDTNPHNRKMTIETIGVIPFFDIKGDVNTVVLDFLKQRVINEDSPQAIMGIGKLLADGIRNEHMSLIYKVQDESCGECEGYDENGNPIEPETTVLYLEYEDFFKRIEDYSQGKMYLSDLVNPKTQELSFTPIQKFLLDLICLSEGDARLFTKLTGKELNPPTFWKTYEDKITGERVTIEITGGGTQEQRELDKKYRDGQYVLISEKVDRSKQDPKSFRLFYQVLSNARGALAYSASDFVDFKTTKTIPVDEPSIKGFQTIRSITINLGLDYANSLINLLNRKVGSYVGFRGLAHEIGSFIELCASLENENPDAQDLVTEKLKHLKWRLFDDEYAVLKRPGKYSEEKKLQLEFAQRVLNSAPSRQRRNYIDHLAKIGFNEHELVNLKKELEILEAIR